MKNCLRLGALIILLLAPGRVFGEPVGKIFDLAGSVKLTPMGGVEVNAAKDASVSEGDRLVTGDAPAFVQINFFDKSKVKLGPNSSLTITTKSSQFKMVGLFRKRPVRKFVTQLDLNVGKALIQVEGFRKKSASFEVRTPTAVAGVRGTLFSREFIPARIVGEGEAAKAGRLPFGGLTVGGMPMMGMLVAQLGGAKPVDRVTVFRGTVSYKPKDVPKPQIRIIKPGRTSQVTGNQNPEPPQKLPKSEIQAKLESFGVDQDPNAASLPSEEKKEQSGPAPEEKQKTEGKQGEKEKEKEKDDAPAEKDDAPAEKQKAPEKTTKTGPPSPKKPTGIRGVGGVGGGVGAIPIPTVRETAVGEQIAEEAAVTLPSPPNPPTNP